MARTIQTPRRPGNRYMPLSPVVEKIVTITKRGRNDNRRRTILKDMHAVSLKGEGDMALVFDTSMASSGRCMASMVSSRLFPSPR